MRMRLWLALAACAACDDGGGGGASAGAGFLGAACYGNGTCDDGLVCSADGTCVEGEGDARPPPPGDAAPVDGEPPPTGDAAADAAPSDAAADAAPEPDGAPVGCGPLRPCPEGQVCLESGECAADGACREDTDCPGARICVDGGCPEPEVCFGPDDCDAPRVCGDGACVEPCAGDAGCADDEICVDGACLATPECVDDADCAGTRACVGGRCPEPAVCFGADDCDDGRACADGECRASCGGDADCPGLQRCEAGVCRESGRCVDHADCEGERVCGDGQCAERCQGDLDCAGTRQCDLVSGVCPPPPVCVLNEDCDGGRECSGGRCVQGCVGADVCPGRQRCDQALAICVEPAVCEGDADCVDGRVCDGGACHARCANDRDCGGAQTCQVDTGHCRAPAGCVGDDDCPGLQLCGPAGVCFEPACEVNADCAEGACVDRACASAPPAACDAAAPCPGDLVCADGGCVLDGPCAADAACPAGAPRCDVAGGRCVVCLGQADCAAAEACVDGVCRFHGACAADGDCPGDRVCQAGACVPGAACAGDRFDRDPASAMLVLRTYTGLVLCDGATDRFTLDQPAGAGLRIVARHAAEAGDLAVALVDPSTQQVLSASDGRHGVETVGLQPGDAPRALELRVTGRPGFTVPYTLTLERLPEGACIPDALEGPLGNDERARAPAVGLGEHALELCPGEEDWLALHLPAGAHLSARASAVGAELTLFGPDGAQAASVRDEAELAFDAAAAGRHLLRVRAPGAAAAVPLSLSIAAWSLGEAAACAQPLVLEPGRPLTVPASLPIQRFTVACSGELEADALVRFTLPRPAVVSVRAAGATALALRRDCADFESEQACAAGDRLDGLALPAGDWFAIVKSATGARPTVTVEARTPCDGDADCAGGAVCDGGLCHPRCGDDDDCPGAQICIAANGHCREPAECGAPEDCAGLRQCRYDGRCFTPECAENADCDEGACVDETCAAAAPADCVADGECPGAQVCARAGVCVLDQACRADADCPDGTPVCSVADGLCVVCAVDAHCQPGERCDGGRCVYLGGCDGDEDCPGDRACGQDGLCRPADGCPGDRFDGTVPTLAARTHGGLLLCDGTQDRFVVEQRAGEGIRVVLRHDADAGDLSLDLQTGPPLAQPLGRSDGTLGVEAVQAPGDALARPLHIVVSGRPGFSTPYTLTVERLPHDACAPDAFEGVSGNDDAARAVGLDVGAHALSLCPEDEDWFALELAAGTRLTARARPAGGPLELDLALLDGREAPLVAAIAEGDGWALAADVATAGRHLLRARAPGVAARRDVELQIGVAAAPNAEAAACVAPLRLAPGQREVLPLTLPVLRFAHSCGFGFEGLSRDYVATFTLAAPGTVTFESSPGSAVALRSTCADPRSESFCALSGAPELTDLPLAAGTWYVVLQTFSPDVPTLRLTVR